MCLRFWGEKPIPGKLASFEYLVCVQHMQLEHFWELRLLFGRACECLFPGLDCFLQLLWGSNFWTVHGKEILGMVMLVVSTFLSVLSLCMY